jgi:SapC
MRTALLYQQPVALSRDAHRHLRLAAGKASFSYARRTNCVPLACSEFAVAASEYPIVFSADKSDESLPVALLGMRENENLFISREGAWQADYIPAFVRRYPFLLAERDARRDFTVCVDESYAAFSSGAEGEPLFLSDGRDAPALTQAIEFLGNYHDEVERSRAFVARMSALDLLMPRAIDMTAAGGAKFVLQGFSIVDEKRLDALDDGIFCELRRCGYLRCIYAHLFSLGNVARLSSRLELRLTHDRTSAA